MEHPNKKCFKCDKPVTIGMQFIEQEYKPFMDYAPCITLFCCDAHIIDAKKEVAQKLKEQIFGKDKSE